MSRGRRSSQRARVGERRGRLKGARGRTEKVSKGRLRGGMVEGGGEGR